MSGVLFDLDAYLERIGVSSMPSADLASLRALHLAHRQAIPFENLDIQMGRPIRLDLDSLQAKLVGARRGGYCFEQNTLFLHALRALGFEVVPCEARVRPPGASRITPRTHMVLIATVDGADWLLDVGFGGSGPLEPVALCDGPAGAGEPQEQHGWAYRVVRLASDAVGSRGRKASDGVRSAGGKESDPEHRGAAVRLLQIRSGAEWRDLYAFVPEPRYPIDFEVANWFTSTHPDSRFVVTLTVQRSTPEARHVLHDLTYTRSTPQSEEAREIGRDELMEFLAEQFGIRLPPDARFRAIDG